MYIICLSVLQCLVQWSSEATPTLERNQGTQGKAHQEQEMAHQSKQEREQGIHLHGGFYLGTIPTTDRHAQLGPISFFPQRIISFVP